MTSCFNLFSPSFVVLGIERRASGICGGQSTTKLQTQTDSLIENHKEHIFTLFSQSQIYRGGEGSDNMDLWTREFFLLFIKIHFKWLRRSFEALRISPIPLHGQWLELRDRWTKIDNEIWLQGSWKEWPKYTRKISYWKLKKCAGFLQQIKLRLYNLQMKQNNDFFLKKCLFFKENTSLGGYVSIYIMSPVKKYFNGLNIDIKIIYFYGFLIRTLI